MKQILNWRMWVIHLLLAAGLLCVLAIFSDDDRPLASFIRIRLMLAATASLCFLSMRSLRIRWEAKGKIKRFLNPEKY